MARTNKRGGNSAKLKHSSPNKFFSKVLGGVGNMASKMLGGGGGRKIPPQSNMGRGGIAEMRGLGVFGGGRPNLPGGGGGPVTAGSVFGGGAPGMAPGPLAKRVGFKKYKCEMCASPMRATDAVLVRGAYDAASGKGTTKYGQIAKARAFGDIAKTIGETTASWARVQAPKRRISMKKNLKNQMKTNKLRQRKSKGFFDNMRYA
jgi:hypothetical protein